MKLKMSVLITILALLLVTGCATNPISGKSQLMLFSEDYDVEIGQSYAPEVEKQMGGRIQNLTLQNYVNRIGRNVASFSHRPDFNYSFTALEDEMINAFALPGGYIFITRGMLEKLENEAQLAAILGHETVHVVARHSTNQMSKQIGISLILAAASTQTSGGAMQIADIAAQMVTLRYSREDEAEADLAGLDYMVQAGYDPKAMANTFRMLNAEPGQRPPEFLSTHPDPGNRVEYIEQAIRDRGYDRLNLKVGVEEYKRNVLDELSR